MPGLEIETQLGVLPLIRDPPSPKQNPQSKKIKRRDTELDPLILAVAFASGPHVTRNHHSHNFLPTAGDPRAEGVWDWAKQDPKRRSYQSQQAPRKQRLRVLGLPVDPEPQDGTVTSPTEVKSPSFQTHAKPLKPSITNVSVPNERACYVNTIS
jgi:GTP cyclohydrolase II